MKFDSSLNPYLYKASIIHSLDPRVKLSLALAFILTINLIPHSVWVLFPILFSMTLSLAVLGGFGIPLLLRRSLWALPFVMAAIPLLFTVEGSIWFMFKIFGFSLTASWQGLELVFSIVLKAWISIQTAVILITTTKFEEILNALRWLHVPKLLVAVISLMWRYLFVLVDEVQRLMTARTARSAKLENHRSGGKLTWRARVTGYMAGSLLLRSIERSERVYLAMLSRGYDGEVRSLRHQSLGRQDLYLLVLGLFFCVLLLFAGVYLGRVF